jgi:hypothetical protein
MVTRSACPRSTRILFFFSWAFPAGHQLCVYGQGVFNGSHDDPDPLERVLASEIFMGVFAGDREFVFRDDGVSMNGTVPVEAANDDVTSNKHENRQKRSRISFFSIVLSNLL